MDRLVSALAGRYTIERELGRGGMATVYLVHDVKHKRKVALKVFKPELFAAEGAQRFLQEITTVANLQHPHILPLFDSGEADSFLYYVMPYVEGESLRDRLNREKQIPLDDAVEITREVADALSCAHRYGVIHRDIKPENILLAAGHAMVADFGVARAIGEAWGTRLTGTGIAIGTPAYMSPEQAAGSGDLDCRSDVYSLGCVLYEMLTGETPHTGPTPQSILAKKLSEPIPRVSVLRDSVSPSVEAALAKALARAPVDRFTTADQLSDALDPSSTAADTPLPPAAPTLVGHHFPWSRMGLPALAAAITVAGAVVVGRWAWRGTSEPGQAEGVSLRAVLYDNPSVAILPLRNLGAAQDEPFVEGLHDDILAALQKIGGLTVISNTSVQRYRDRGMLLPDIARELRVDAVGEGTVSRGGNRIRVNVQLIDGASDAHLWSEQYDRELSAANVFAIRGEIARAVAKAMRAELTSDEQARLDAAPPTSLTAYDWRQIALSRCSGCVERGEAYHRALEADSAYAAAWAGLAENYAIRVLTFGTPTSLADSALTFADRALELDPELASAYNGKGMAYYAGRGQTARALDYARRAAQLEPGNASRWTNVGVFAAVRGNWVDALDAYWRSLRLRPTSAMLRGNMAELYAALGLPARAAQVLAEGAEIDPTDVTVIHYGSYTQALSGNLERAREMAERNVDLQHQARTHQWAALVAGAQGDFEAARSHAEKAWELAPEGLSLESNVHSVPVTLAFALMRTGAQDEAQRLLDTALDQLHGRLERGADDGYTRVEIAAIEAVRGRPAEAARWLKSASDAGYRYYREIELDPMFAGVRGYAGFERIMDLMRVDVDAMRRRVLEQEADLEKARVAERNQ